MEELFSSFPIPFRANSLFPKLVISVGFYPEKVENLEDLPLFTPIFSNSPASFTRSWAPHMKRNRFDTFFKKETDFSIDFDFFRFSLGSLGNSIPYWNWRDFTPFPDYVTGNGTIPTPFYTATLKNENYEFLFFKEFFRM